MGGGRWPERHGPSLTAGRVVCDRTRAVAGAWSARCKLALSHSALGVASRRAYPCWFVILPHLLIVILRTEPFICAQSLASKTWFQRCVPQTWREVEGTIHECSCFFCAASAFQVVRAAANVSTRRPTFRKHKKQEQK